MLTIRYRAERPGHSLLDEGLFGCSLRADISGSVGLDVCILAYNSAFPDLELKREARRWIVTHAAVWERPTMSITAAAAAAAGKLSTNIGFTTKIIAEPIGDFYGNSFDSTSGDHPRSYFPL